MSGSEFDKKGLEPSKANPLAGVSVPKAKVGEVGNLSSKGRALPAIPKPDKKETSTTLDSKAGKPQLKNSLRPALRRASGEIPAFSAASTSSPTLPAASIPTRPNSAQSSQTQNAVKASPEFRASGNKAGYSDKASPISEAPISRRIVQLGVDEKSSQIAPVPEVVRTLPESDLNDLSSVISDEFQRTVLLIGAGKSLFVALAKHLRDKNFVIEQASLNEMESLAVALAPDLVVLTADAARDGGADSIARLSRSPLTATIPVVLLADHEEVDGRLEAFRHGAAAVIPRSYSVVAIADELERLAQEIPERGGTESGTVGEMTLHDLVGALSKQLRTGILSVRGENEEQSVRLVLGKGKPLLQTMDDFVRQIKQHVVSAEPLNYEFSEFARGALEPVGSSKHPSAGDIQLKGLRIVVSDDQVSRVDRVAQSLRQYGADVAVIGLSVAASGLDSFRDFDPSALIIDKDALVGEKFDVVRAIRKDTRLRWASLVMLSWNELDSDSAGLSNLARAVEQAASAQRSVEELLAKLERAVEIRLDTIGPARLIRVLCDANKNCRLELVSRRLKARLDFSNGLLVGAIAKLSQQTNLDGEFLEGPAAVRAFLAIAHGKVKLSLIEAASHANIMAPADLALNLAEQEQTVLQPSIPAGMAIPSVPPSPGESSSASAESEEPIDASGADLGRENLDAELLSDDGVLVEELVVRVSEANVVPPNITPQKPSKLGAEILKEAGVTAPQVSFASVEIAEEKHASFFQSKRAILLASAVIGFIAAGVFLYQQQGSPSTDVEATSDSASSDAEREDKVPQKIAVKAPAEGEKAKENIAEKTVEDPSHSDSSVDEPKIAHEAAASRLLGISEILTVTRGGKDVKSCEDALGADVWTELKENIAQSLSNTLNSRRALMMGNFAAAQLDLCRAVKQDPKNAEAAQNLVRLFLQQGQAEEALVYSQALSKNQPDNLVLQDLLGDALLLSGDETAAAELWKKLYGDRSEEPMRRTLGVWLATAAQAAKANDYSKAERLYARVIVFEQQSFAAWYGITESALRLQNFARAARCAASAAHINPESAMVKLYWGDALKGQEDADGAISKWSEAFRLDRKLGKAVLRLKEAGVDYRTL